MDRVLVACGLAITCLPPCAAENSTYQKRESWVATMVATREHLQARSLADAGGPASPPSPAQRERLGRQLWRDWPEQDWLMQDSPVVLPGGVAAEFVCPGGWYFDLHRDHRAEIRLIQRVLDELGGMAPDLEADPSKDLVPELAGRLRQLASAATPAGAADWLDLYIEACQFRRQRRLAPFVGSIPRFVYTKHYVLGGSHYAYTEGLSDAQAERHFQPGAALCLAEWNGQAFVETLLIQDDQGVIRDPDVSYDGHRILFAWKKSDRADDYHLYELEVASRSVRQLTDGLGVADYEAAYLPCGEIVFNSTRCVQTVDCWWTEVSNLYRSDGDGRGIRRLTFDQVHDNFPTVTADGRILYTRWEYNDRGQIYPQPLLQMRPDGTGQSEFYGGNSWFPTTILHARGIPGTSRAVAIAAGHHTKQAGKLIVIDPARGRQEDEGVRLIAPERETPAVRIDKYGQDGELFQYPYPVSESEFLVAYHPVGWRWQTDPLGPRFGIYWMSSDGRRERLVSDASLPCGQPIPLRPRTIAPLRPESGDRSEAAGTCYIQDVHAGPGLNGVTRGQVKSLRVVSVRYRAAGIGDNRNSGPGGGALISTPVAVGNGTWDPKVILGEAAVHPDGSAFFRVPARTPLYFQLLDDRGRMIQTMRSWTTLQPGEHVSCTGCHEHKNTTPIAHRPLAQALCDGPEELVPFFGPSRGFSFTAEIQPILDRHCVRCHSGPDGDPPALSSRAVLDPAAKRFWTESYLALTHARPDHPERGSWRGQADAPGLNWVSTQSTPTLLPPRSAGSLRSEWFNALEQGHGDVRLSQAELRKIAAWIDLGVPFCGDYTEAAAWSDAEWEVHDRYTAKRKRLQIHE